MHNAYYSSGYKYGVSDEAARINFVDGKMSLQPAAAGSANAAITWIQGITILANGKVGIGTPAPVGKLHVYSGDAGTVTPSSQADDLVVEASTEGGITIMTPNDQSARIRFTSPATESGDLGGADIFYRQNINKMSIGTTVSGGKLAFKSGAGVETMVLNGGKVGIGTDDPEGQLTLQNDDAYLRIRSNTTTTKGLTLRYNHAGNFGQLLVDHQGNNQLAMKYYALTHTFGRSDSDKMMTIDSSGNVGIGVAPASGIQLQTGNAANGSAVTRVTNGTTFVDLTASSSGKAFLEVGSAHPLILATAATERMRIDATGRVSFGPDASDILIDPASTNGNNNLIYMRGNATGDKSSIQMNHFGSADYFIGVGHAGTGLLNIARDQTGGDFVMNTSGNIGIGVVPRARLDVLQTTNRTSLTGTARGTLHLQDGDTPANNEITAITFESNSNNASSIIGQKLTNNGSSLFFGTSNNYSAGVTNTGLTINHYGTVSVGAGLELPGYIYNNSDVMKTYSLAGPNGTNLTRTINVNTYWGFAAQGGHFHFSINGWQTDLAAGTIQWHNAGSSAQVITGVQVQNNFSPVGLSVSVAKGSGNYDINITLGSTHSNAHGWVWKVWA